MRRGGGGRGHGCGAVAVGRGGQVMSAWGMVGLPRRRSAPGCPDAATTRGDYGVGDEKKVKKRREDYGFKVCRWVMVACWGCAQLRGGGVALRLCTQWRSEKRMEVGERGREERGARLQVRWRPSRVRRRRRIRGGDGGDDGC